MINFEGFHGTDNAHVGSILSTGFRSSVGDSEWLGDGVYFFLNGKSAHPDLQAEQWAILSAWDKSSQANKYDVFSVLKADISVDDSYLLDLTDPSGLEIFDYIKGKCYEKLKHMPRIKIIDGYLINAGRNELGLQIDVVKGDVYIKLSREERRLRWIHSRIPNSTICSVYNSKCISDIQNIKTARI